MESSEFPYTPCHHACQASSFTSIPHQIDTLVIFNEPAMIHNYQWTPIIYIRIVFSIGFVKYIMTCSSHFKYHIVKILCALTIQFSPHNLQFFLIVFIVLPCPECHIHGIIQNGAFFSDGLLLPSNMCLRFLHVLSRKLEIPREHFMQWWAW